MALGESTQAHCRHFGDVTSDGTLHTSIYIRKEFIHRWILDYAEMAFVVDHFSDLSEALLHLNQDYSIRKIKTANHAVTLLLREKGGVENCRAAAKELGRLAVAELKKFDRRFRSRIPQNRSGCQIGGKPLTIDFNYFFHDLRAFVESQDTVVDCPINEFLKLGGNGSALRLLEFHGVDQTKAGKRLNGFFAQKKWITCVECATIGDAVITLEQPRAYCLVHIDHDFKILCSATALPHKPILSERAVEKTQS